jgi:peptidoglycan/LPS O-acetylase OafA/YrhL
VEKYHPSIDGLRAIAVLCVCFFHLDHRWLSGGFVGVDVFFVISGYLITSIIARDCREKRFSFLAFYQRRVSRILPASVLVALVSLGSAVALYTSMDAASAGTAVASAVPGVLNIKLLFQGNYFESSLDAQPLLHFWSLSLEEQFYLVYPAFYVLVSTRLPGARTLIIAGLLVASLLACGIATPLAPSASFYLLPTRAWELLAGGLVATLHHDRRLIHAMPGAGGAGLGLVAVAVMVTPNTAAFPGFWPVLPVLGTALLLCEVARTSMVNNLLSMPVMVAVGRVSYSLYLWHWPIFSFVDYTMPFANEMVRVISKCLLTLVATVASYRLVENPCRKWLNAPRRFWAAGCFLASALILAVGLGLWVRGQMYLTATPRELAKGGKTFTTAADAMTVALVGDSLGSMYAKSMQKACAARGLNFVVLSLNGGDPLPGIDGPTPLWTMMIAGLRRTRPDVVVVACDWRRKLAERPERFDEALRDVKTVSGRVVVVLQQPYLPPNATRAAIRTGCRPPFREDADVRAGRLKANEAIRRAVADGCEIIDAASFFESIDGDIEWQDESRRQLFQDRNHLSGVGAERVVAAVMQELEENGKSRRRFE